MDKLIDLHLHLDGAITIDIAKKLARLQNISLPDDEKLTKLLTVDKDCKSLNDFLKCFEFPLSLLQTKKALSRAVYLVCESLKSQGLIYAEIRFAPSLHTKKGLSKEDAVKACLEGLEASSLKANLILCLMRGEDNDKENYETLEICKKYLVDDAGVVALDLAGAEGLFKTEKYRDIFLKAKGEGIPFTIHAGEADGAESVRLAIEYGARRIGHGVRITEDESVIRLVKEKGIFLEMCLTSNRQTHAVENMADYPLKRFLEEGLKVTLNTDDMAIENIELSDEFEYAQKVLKITEQQTKELLLNAVDAAFTNTKTKEELRKITGG